MVRSRKKKALYEVISRTGSKSSYDRLLRQPRPGETGGKDKPTASEPATLSRGVGRWPRRPRIVQFNAGRIEISMPYQLAIALLLGLVLLVVVAFRLGQITYLSSQKATDSTAKMSESVQRATPEMIASIPRRAAPAEERAAVSPVAPKVEPVKPKGNNRIVIQTYQVRADLEPVKQYFAQFGIETEIIKIDGWYHLATKDKYENPEKQGTDGYLAKQRIIELGAEYKAPPGYETFGSKPFSDAYGKRFDE
jgi:hypothetical protein